MKKVLFFAGLLSLSLTASALHVNPVPVNVGDVVTLGTPSTFTYSSLKFPKSNFIIKRGGIINYNSLAGLKVQVVSIEDTEGSRVAVIRRADGRKFFNVLPTVKVELDHAVDKKELLLTENYFFLD